MSTQYISKFANILIFLNCINTFGRTCENVKLTLAKREFVNYFSGFNFYYKKEMELKFAMFLLPFYFWGGYVQLVRSLDGWWDRGVGRSSSN